MLPTVLRQLFAFVFEMMFGLRMQAYVLLVPRLSVPVPVRLLVVHRARTFVRV